MQSFVRGLFLGAPERVNALALRRQVVRTLIQRDLTFAPLEILVLVLLPGVSSAERVVLLVIYGAGLLPTALLAGWCIRRGRDAAGVVLYMVGALLLFATAGIVVPQLQAALLAGYVALYGVVLVLAPPRVATLSLVLGVSSAAATYAVTDGEQRFGVASLVVLPLLFWGFGPVISAVLRAHESALEHLERLRQTSVGVVPSSDLAATLKAVTRGVCTSCAAEFAAVVLKDGSEYEPRSIVPAGLTWRRVVEAVGESRMGAPWEAAAAASDVVVRHGVDFPSSGETGPAGTFSVVAAPLTTAADGRAGALVVGVRSELYSDTVRDIVRDCAGDVVAHLVVHDLAFEKLAGVTDDLRGVVEAEERAVSAVSHELRSPLTATIGFLATVERNWERLPDERRRDLIGRAGKAAARQAAIVDRMLDTVRATRGQLVVEPHPLRLGDEVQRVIGDFELDLERHSVLTHVDPDILVQADENAFDRILGNLLVNAAKYAPAGTTIAVTAIVRDGEVIVSVADEGPGLDPSDVDRIFEPYTRGSASTVGTGAGIGLHLVRSYAELLGGRASVISEPGRGSTFYFTLPLATAASIPAEPG